MPIFKAKNEKFFEKWSHGTAYILGFLFADGSLSKNKRGAHFIELQITDRDLLEKIRSALSAEHKISRREMPKPQKPIYRLQIGSKKMFGDLVRLGLMPRKTKVAKFPSVPLKYLSSFVRGYFEGDGNVWTGLVHKKRRKATVALRTVFTSGNRRFLKGLANILKFRIGIAGVLSYYSNAYRLIYSTRASINLYKFMYNKPALYLERKKKIFEKYLNGVVV